MAKSVLQTDKTVCYLCGQSSGKLDEHHVFEGTANRSKSDDDSMTIYVHRVCHRWLHEHPKSALTIKARAQRKWEELYGNREEFIKRYGRNYLDD